MKKPCSAIPKPIYAILLSGIAELHSWVHERIRLDLPGVPPRINGYMRGFVSTYLVCRLVGRQHVKIARELGRAAKPRGIDKRVRGWRIFRGRVGRCGWLVSCLVGWFVRSFVC